MESHPPGHGSTVFSPDGFWWWDGAEWRSTLSPDGRWRWNGRAWEPVRPAAPPRKGSTAAVLITVLSFAAVLLLVSVLTIVVLLTMGNQIANVFSNVVAALNGE